MDTPALLTAALAIIGAVTSLYNVWLTRHKARAEARVLDEQAETEDAKQRRADLNNLRAIIEQWQNRCGQLVQDQDALRAQVDAEAKRSRTIETEAAARINDLEQQATFEREARMEAERRAQGQATLLVKLQDEVGAWRERQTALERVIRELARGVEILLQQLNSLGITPAWLPEDSLMQAVSELGKRPTENGWRTL